MVLRSGPSSGLELIRKTGGPPYLFEFLELNTTNSRRAAAPMLSRTSGTDCTDQRLCRTAMIVNVDHQWVINHKAIYPHELLS